MGGIMPECSMRVVLCVGRVQRVQALPTKTQDTSWPWVAIGKTQECPSPAKGGVAVATAVILASGGLRKETGKACLGCPIWATPVI